MRFIKKLLPLLLAFAVALLPSCKKADFSDGGGDFYSFTDDTGREVSIADKPARVAVLFSSFAEMWQLAGGETAVSVGESAERGFVNDSIIFVDGAAGKVIDLEALVAAKPDLVIGSADIQKQRETCEFMAGLGVPSALFRVETFEDYARVMGHMCAITENGDAFEEHVVKVQKQIDGVLAKYSGEKQKSILFIRAATSAGSTKAKTAKDSFVCAMLKELGAHNIADDAPVLLDGLSVEAVIKSDPDFIFVSTMGDEQRVREYMDGVLGGDVWQTLRAVRLGNYAYLPKEMFQYKPNHRFGEAYQYLAELLYE